MYEKEDDRGRESVSKIIRKNLDTSNWVDFNEQYLLVVAKTNTDVERLIITGKDPR